MPATTSARQHKPAPSIFSTSQINICEQSNRHKTPAHTMSANGGCTRNEAAHLYRHCRDRHHQCRRHLRECSVNCRMYARATCARHPTCKEKHDIASTECPHTTPRSTQRVVIYQQTDTQTSKPTEDKNNQAARQPGSQADRKSGRQTDRHTDSIAIELQGHSGTERHTSRHTDRL